MNVLKSVVVDYLVCIFFFLNYHENKNHIGWMLKGVWINLLLCLN